MNDRRVRVNVNVRREERFGCIGGILRLFISAGVLCFVAWLLQPHVTVESYWWALLVALVIGVLNVIVKPVLILLTLPATILTLGLFVIVINAVVLWLADWLMGTKFEFASFWWALLAALIIAVVNAVLDAFLKGLRGETEVEH